MRGSYRFAWAVLAAVALGGPVALAQRPDRRQLDRIEQALQREGDAVVALADEEEGPDPPGFALQWRQDFFKASNGTFVPFIVGITPSDPDVVSVLLYVRLSRRGGSGGNRRAAARDEAPAARAHVFEEIYPVELMTRARGGSRDAVETRVVRGLSVAPGEYDLTVAVRERAERRSRRLAAVLRRQLSVPDFSPSSLTTSSVILADRISAAVAAPRESGDRPYVIGAQEILPIAEPSFGRHQELVVVFLVYRPALKGNAHFDLEVEYHFFRKRAGGEEAAGETATPSPGVKRPAAKPGEIYVNRTEPQRFNPALLGGDVEQLGDQPVMAGQGVPLVGFQEGDYRLAITVTDLLSGRSIERDVTFTVRSSPGLL